jgi:DNA-binding beta-propeller fold protein YncE
LPRPSTPRPRHLELIPLEARSSFSGIELTGLLLGAGGSLAVSLLLREALAATTDNSGSCWVAKDAAGSAPADTAMSIRGAAASPQEVWVGPPAVGPGRPDELTRTGLVGLGEAAGGTPTSAAEAALPGAASAESSSGGGGAGATTAEGDGAGNVISDGGGAALSTPGRGSTVDPAAAAPPAAAQHQPPAGASAANSTPAAATTTNAAPPPGGVTAPATRTPGGVPPASSQTPAAPASTSGPPAATQPTTARAATAKLPAVPVPGHSQTIASSVSLPVSEPIQFVTTPDVFLPRALTFRPGFTASDQQVAVVQGSTESLNVTTPVVNVVQLTPTLVYVCNYSNLYLLDTSTGEGRVIPMPAGVDRWVPTGLAFDRNTNTLFVANYLGKDVLVLDVDAGWNVHLQQTIVRPDLVGPENVALSSDGSYLAVADYDGSKVHVFDRQGQLVWNAPVGECHGVAITPDDRYVIASGLNDRAIYKFDLQTGTLLASVGRQGWSRDQYLWPVSITIDPQGQIVVADSQTGRLSFLDANLHCIYSIGGNGPTDALFNMPYCVYWDQYDQGKLWVCDTFRGRLIQVDPFANEIQRIYLLSTDSLFDAYSTPGSELTAFNRNPGSAHVPALYLDGSARPLGYGYNGYTQENRTVEIDLPGLGTGVWHPDFGGFSWGSPSRFLTTLGSPALTSGSLYYFLFAENYAVEGRAYTILWSQDCATVTVIHDGFFVPVAIKMGLWDKDGILLSHGQQIPFADIIALADSKLAQFRSLVESGGVARLQALRAAYYSSDSEEQFRTGILDAAFVSPAGKAFLSAFLDAPSLAAQQSAADNFFNAMQGASVVNLPEVLFANALTQPFPATQLVVTTPPPALVTSENPFTVVVSAEDPSGNVDTNYSGNVTIAIGTNPAGGTLGGTLTVPVVNGVATFSNLTLDLAGSGYTLQLSATGLSSVTTSAIGVTPGPATSR